MKVILFHETLYQKADDGTPFVDLIKAAGIIPVASKPEEDKKSAGAVSGTDSESDAPQGK